MKLKKTIEAEIFIRDMIEIIRTPEYLNEHGTNGRIMESSNLMIKES